MILFPLFCTERLLLQCPSLENVHASGCQDMLIEAIQSQVTNQFSCFLPMAKTLKRVTFTFYLPNRGCFAIVYLGGLFFYYKAPPRQALSWSTRHVTQRGARGSSRVAPLRLVAPCHWARLVVPNAWARLVVPLTRARPRRLCIF